MTTVVEKVNGRFPITALDVLCLENEQYLIWGTGPEVWIENTSSGLQQSFVLSGCDSVHNIRTFPVNNALAVFGGKSFMLIVFIGGKFSIHSKVEQLDDLVLDFALLGKDSIQSNSVNCYIGYAHNFVDIAQIIDGNTYVCTKRVCCPELSVLFTMTFYQYCTESQLIIASGTVFGKIILWKVETEQCITKSEILCIANEHEGVIFRMKWSDDMTKMISASDDRTLRMWKIHKHPINSLPIQLELVYTAWGHVSRVWDTVFLQNDHEVASCSEDGTVKLWNNNGECISTMRGHSNDVWRIATSPDRRVLISGGNDSSIKMWDVDYQRRTSPDKLESTQVSLPIPMWQCNIEESEKETSTIDTTTIENIAVIESEGGPDEVVLTEEAGAATKVSKKKSNPSSRRANGVCGVRVSPCLRWLVVVLVEGGVWIVDQTGSADMATADEETATAGQWLPVQHLHAIVSTIDAEFTYLTEEASSVRIALAQLNGEVVLLSVTLNSHSATTATATVQSMYTWRPHEMRTVNVWFEYSSIQNTLMLVTATVKGICAIWKINEPTSTSSDSTVSLWCTFNTANGEIATACLVVVLPETSYLVLGDARGSLTLFSLPSLHEDVCELTPVVVYSKLHGSDPVSCIARYNAGFVTTGHDGMLHVFTEISGEGKAWAHTSKRNCLPINTPDQIIVVEKTTTETSRKNQDCGLYVCGYHGSVYIIWDILQGYQVLRVEGGGWKRPHRAALTVPQLSTAGATALVRDLPSVLFVCPAPLLKDNTVLQIFGSVPQLNEISTASTGFPLLRGCPALGRVGYCTALITTTSTKTNSSDELPQSDFVVVGGEDSCVKVYSVPDLLLQQEVSLSMNSSLKSLCFARSEVSSDRGIVLGGGGKLQYYIWIWDQTLRQPKGHSLGDVLFTAVEGSIWAKATQDHRILSVQCMFLDSKVHTSMTGAESEEFLVERYLLLLCDSRGHATIGIFEHSPGRGLLSAVHKPRFHIVQQLQPSQCPVLSCSLLRVNNCSSTTSVAECIEQGDSILALFGDTAGVISVWKLSLLVGTQTDHLSR